MIALNQSDAFDVIECDSEERWLAERNKGIGASEVAVLLGLSDWASPFSLWAQKTGQVDAGASDAEFLEWGRFAEDGIAKRYAYRTKRAIRDLGRFTILRSKAHPFLFCTLDRIIDDVPRIEDGFYPWQPYMVGPGALEIKQATIFGHHAWDEGAPLKVQSQLQTQLAVTGWKWGSISATMPTGKFEAIDCERNESFIDLVIEKCRAFWACVEGNTWPPVDGSDWTAQALKTLYPRDNGAEVFLPTEAAQWDAELAEAKEQKKLAEAHEKEITNRFKAALGEATFGVLPGGSKYSLKTQTRKEFTSPATSFRVLRKVGQ